MISRTEIFKIARQKGFPAGVIEKEYMLTLFLEQLAKNDGGLIFKGGTALSKVYLDYYRISEDLDFTYIGGDITKAKEIIYAVCNHLGLEIKDDNETRNGYNAIIKFIGPLDYQNFIKVDVSTREIPVLEPRLVEINTFYPEIEPFVVNVFDLMELTAEKIRTLMQRSKPRDYFDVWFLLENRTFDSHEIKEVVFEKCMRIGIEYEPPKIFSDIETLEKQWKMDLIHLVKELSDFDTVISMLRKELEFLK